MKNENNIARIRQLSRIRFTSSFRLLVLLAAFLLVLPVFAQSVEMGDRDKVRTVLVTAVAHNDRTRSIADRLQPGDFAVKEKDIPQKILSAKKVAGEPMVLAVLLQDNLVLRVNNELKGIKRFIEELPEGSRVMTGYISSGSLRVRQEFTDDRKLAANSLRIITSSQTATPYSPYIQIKEAVRMFDGEAQGRRIALVVTDGQDNALDGRLASPFFSLYLDSAIFEAQRQGVSIYTFYAPPAQRGRFFRRALNSAQGSLLRLADETGGEAFFTGSDFVTFNPYFKEFGEILAHQWLITYESSNTGKGFRKIEVTTDFDIDLQHIAGYRVN